MKILSMVHGLVTDFAVPGLGNQWISISGSCDMAISLPDLPRLSLVIRNPDSKWSICSNRTHIVLICLLVSEISAQS